MRCRRQPLVIIAWCILRLQTQTAFYVCRLAANTLNKQLHAFTCYTVIKWALVNITVKLQVTSNLCSLCLHNKNNYSFHNNTMHMACYIICLCCCNTLEIIHILAYANSIINEVCNSLSQFWTGEGVSQLSLHQWQVSKPYSKTSLNDSSLLGCYAMWITKQLMTWC